MYTFLNTRDKEIKHEVQRFLLTCLRNSRIPLNYDDLVMRLVKKEHGNKLSIDHCKSWHQAERRVSEFLCVNIDHGFVEERNEKYRATGE